ncbi:MAG: hypothetical protein F6J93_21410 [Oscillatoria sp. SIO1A7]|nr:hypothetical protein [Oscillatoria sp. SIO1A7]
MKNVGYPARELLQMKTPLLILLLASAAIALPGCTPPKPEPKTTASAPNEIVTITLSGSGGGSQILKSIGKPFASDRPQIRLDFLSGSRALGGSGLRMYQGLREGALDIGIALSPDISRERAEELELLTIAEDPLTFVVDPKLPIEQLTLQQLQDIFAGRITSWQEVGGPDAAIVVLVRQEDEGSTTILRQVVFGEIPFAESATLLNKAEDMRKAVTDIPNSIGYMSYGDFVINQVKAKAIAVDGASPADYAQGKYPIPPRILAISYSPSNLPKVSSYINYLKSDRARELLQENGLKPID